MASKNFYYVSVLCLSLLVLNYVACARYISKNPQICKTKACASMASYLIKNMNQSVDPCDNFYKFACGNYEKNTVIPDDKSSESVVQDLAKIVKQKLKEDIEKKITDKDPKTFKKLQAYYKSCLNTDYMNTNTRKEFLDVLERLGGWPIVEGDSWDEINFDYIDSMLEFRNEGYSPYSFIKVDLAADTRNNSVRVIYLDQPSLPFADEYLTLLKDENVRKAYLQLMTKFFEIMGLDTNMTETELQKSFAFEMELARLISFSTAIRNRNRTYMLTYAKHLPDIFPSIPFTDFISDLMAPHEKLFASDVILISAPVYFQLLPTLLSITPKRIQANYAFWRLALGSIGQLGDYMAMAYQNFTKLLSGGNSVSIPRWKTCLNEVDNTFSLATGALYVRREFDPATKKLALEMVDNMRSTFHDIIANVTWMDPETKKAAIEKLDKMQPLVAYPDELLNDTLLDNYFNDWEVDANSYFINSRNAYYFFSTLKFDGFRKPIDKADWTGLYGAATVVNAFYAPAANTINFPAGILQDAFLSKDLPNYVNYARIGTIVGHEMTHGFDNHGQLYDKDGNMKNWWNDKTRKEFLKRAECFVEQYGNYTILEINKPINGKNTEGENIADNGGLKEAYLAWKLWVKKNHEEPRLPGLQNYTPEQLFWLANTNQWCVKYRPEYVNYTVLYDAHSPNQVRAIGIIKNEKDFARDFNCPVGSNMNPEKKCVLW